MPGSLGPMVRQDAWRVAMVKFKHGKVPIAIALKLVFLFFDKLPLGDHMGWQRGIFC